MVSARLNNIVHSICPTADMLNREASTSFVRFDAFRFLECLPRIPLDTWQTLEDNMAEKWEEDKTDEEK